MDFRYISESTLARQEQKCHAKICLQLAKKTAQVSVTRESETGNRWKGERERGKERKRVIRILRDDKTIASFA